MAIFTEFARPKINLTLRVLGKRADGFHQLESLVAFADGVGDRITLDTGDAPAFTVMGPFANEIAGENLVERAMTLIRTSAPAARLGSVVLEKNLPVASGIGGGSADAAALLRAVRAANPEMAHRIDWHALAAKLGADVPVCVENRAAFMTGIGEHIVPVTAMPRFPAVLVNPQIDAPANKTAAVFRILDAPQFEACETEPGGMLNSAPLLLAAITSGANDLERAALKLMPDIANVLNALLASHGLVLARLSGAGPTCFGIFETQDNASAAAQDLQLKYPKWWVQSVMLT